MSWRRLNKVDMQAIFWFLTLIVFVAIAGVVSLASSHDQPQDIIKVNPDKRSELLRVSPNSKSDGDR